MRKFHREVIALAEACGATAPKVIELPHGRHPRLVGSIDGRAFSMVFGGTLSDWRAPLNIRSRLRRLARGEAVR